MDNIKSFFSREEELSTKPKAVPEAASEVFEKPRIVDRPLPKEPAKLPFSPDDLRAAIKPKEIPRPPEPKPTPARDITHEISHEIVAFETALADAHDNVKTSKYTAQPITAVRPAAPDSLFFNEFEQFLHKEDLASDGIIGSDILWRMKEFHKHRQEGKEYYLYGKDVQAALQRKVDELKRLEQEWFDRRAHADVMEKQVHMIESEIESRAADLKSLMRQIAAKSRLEHKVSAGLEFTLMDGRVLSSLLDLKSSLRTMTDPVFAHHVNATRNDFAEWIRGAMNDAPLADKMGAMRDRHQIDALLSSISSDPPALPGK